MVAAAGGSEGASQRQRGKGVKGKARPGEGEATDVLFLMEVAGV